MKKIVLTAEFVIEVEDDITEDNKLQLSINNDAIHVIANFGNPTLFCQFLNGSKVVNYRTLDVNYDIMDACVRV